MGLTLVTGPANAGKVALLLERYLDALEREPFLIVPNRPDVDRVERDLLRRRPALLGGWIGTFDALFERIAAADGACHRVATDVQRSLVLRRAVTRVSLNGLRASARSRGFADALGEAIGELAAGLLDPADVDGHLADFYRAYLAELESLGLRDRDLERRRAVERLTSDLSAWDGAPVLAYGFEDLTAAQWRLLEALAARAEVTVSLPYEPGRPAFQAVERTARDLQGLARTIEELPPRSSEYAHPALAHLERGLFAAADPADQPPLEGAVRWLEGAGARGALELVAAEVLELIRAGTPLEQIAIVCPSLERWRAPLETAFVTAGIPFALDGTVRLSQTPFGHALLALLRFDWVESRRRDLYAFLRSPYSGLARAHVDFLEGRLRGRAVQPERVEEETRKLRGGSLPVLDALRASATPVDAVRGLARAMLHGAYRLDSPPVGDGARLDLRAYEEVVRVLNELEGWEHVDAPLGRDDVLAALERTAVRVAGAGEAGRVAVLDLMRVRTRRYDTVVVLGLEEGSLPRRAAASPFLDDDARRTLDHARLVRPDTVARDRYLFYTACTRATRRLFLVREATTEDGAPRQASPFWDETRALFDADDVARSTRRRALSALTWPLEAAPTDRERLRALVALAVAEPEAATALALANGWERRLERAVAALDRPTRLTHPAVLEELQARATFSVTDLERFADCSSMWFVDRLVAPRSIDAEVDALLRGSVAHSVLHRFFAGLPKRLGADRVDRSNIEEALVFLRECLDEALASGVWLDLSELERLELEGSLWRDLEGFVRTEAELETPLVPRRFEVSFGSDRSPPELQRGLDLGGFALSGKIDRIDVDPFSARGIVQDYKSGKSAYSAKRIENELLLQIPLYMLVLRDLVGIEPLGGVYRALAGKREARGILRADAEGDGVPGFARNDYLDEDAFWGQVELAKERAQTIVGRIRAGDVRHDPKGGDCPDWCELWTMCRIRRP